MRQSFIQAIAGIAKIGGVRATEFCRYDFITLDQAEFAGTVLVQLEDSFGPNYLVLDIFVKHIGLRGKVSYQVFELTVDAAQLGKSGLLGILLQAVRSATQHPVALNEVGLRAFLYNREVDAAVVASQQFADALKVVQHVAKIPR